METAKWKEAASIMNQFGNVLAGPIWGIVSGLIGAGLGVVPFAVWSNCADYALPYNETISYIDDIEDRMEDTVQFLEKYISA